jgi:hypothetical protein
MVVAPRIEARVARGTFNPRARLLWNIGDMSPMSHILVDRQASPGLVDIGMEMPHAAGPQDVYPVSVALWLFLLDFLSSKVLDVWRVTAVYRRASHKSFVISRLIQA